MMKPMPMERRAELYGTVEHESQTWQDPSELGLHVRHTLSWMQLQDEMTTASIDSQAGIALIISRIHYPII